MPIALPRFRSFRFASLAIFAAALLGGLLPSAMAQRRVVGLAVDATRVALPDTQVPARARSATDLGTVDRATPLTGITLRFNMTSDQATALDQLLAAQQNAASPLYRQWLTPEQYADRFGLSATDLATVVQWLTTQGLTVTSTARSRTFVTVSGTAAQVGTAFETPLHTVLSADGERHITNLSPPSLPGTLAAVVTGITGLDDFHLKPRLHIQSVVAPQFTSSVSGNHYIAPGDFYTIYDTLPLLNTSVNGSGITIAVMGQTDILQSDIAAFRSASGLPANPPTITLYGTDPGTITSDQNEASLDVEWSGAVAPAASILYVNSKDVISGSLTNAIDNNLAPILTVSYGDCESGWGAANLAAYNNLFRQANAQGQTIFGPAGDSGATDCDYQVASARGGLAVDFPASSPYVTGVGGSMFNEGAGTYFSSSNNTYAGSALSYIPEAVWNESATAGSLAAGGGGISSYFAKPAWQTGTGVPNDLSRDVPDVTFNAAAIHDGYLYCVAGSCTSGFRNAAGNLAVVGGTSVSTPAMAGVMALVQQKIAARVGNANPTLYGLAASPAYSAAVFHDITTGNNASPCTAGTTGCPSGGSIGYAATTGYDLATGLGSIDVFNLVNDWLSATPTGTGSSIGSNASTTSITPATNTVSAGTAVSYQVAVRSNTAGLTTIPTGTVQLAIDNVLYGSAVTLGSGAATLPLATTALSSGVHVVSAIYTGDTVYAGSKGSASLDVTSATLSDFTITPVSSTAAAAAGTHTTLVYTVTGLNGLTGNITFTATPTVSAAIDTIFTPTTVALSSTATSATTSLAIYAYHGTVHTASTLPPPMPHLPWWPAGSGLALAGVCLAAWPKTRRRALPLMTALVLSVGMFTAIGCSSSSTTSSGLGTSSVTNAAPGTYTIVVSATGTNSAGTAVTHTANVTFTVM